MAHRYRSVLFVGCLAGMTMALRGPAACADDVAASPFQQSITAWMGVVSFLADDDDAGGDRERDDEKKCECDSEGECGCKEKGKHREHRHRGEQWQRGERGRSPGDRQAKAPREGTPAGGPRPDAIRKLDEILARLSRIEAGMGMGGRPGVAGGPMGQGMVLRMGPADVLRMGPADGPAAAERTRPAMPAEAQAMMEQRMEEGRRRMEESREKMQQARRRFAEMEERIKKLEAEIERMKGAK